jgi:signal transduction histidine kinase
VRRRLLVSTLAVAVAAVLLLGLPLAFVISRLQVSEASQQVRRDATSLARGLQARVNDGTPPNAAQLGKSLLPDRYVIIRQYTVGRTILGEQPPARDTIRAKSVTRDFAVTVEADDSTVVARVVKALLLISALALLAVGVAVALAILQARRLTRPLEELAGAADRLGSGDARPLGRRYGVPELDQVAEGLDGSAQRISDLLSAGRDFAADASHQLRTPLTALSMRLEEIVQADDPRIVKEEARSALAQVERLVAVVEHLLDSVRDNNLRAGPVALDHVVLQQVVEWEPAFGKVNRRIVATGTRGLVALATHNGLSQVLATLLENSLTHGGGKVTVSTRSTGISLVVEVTDEGPGVPPELGARIFERSVSGRRSTGLGLAVARELAESEGGRLELVQQKPPVFALFLSAAGAGPR